MPPTDLLAEPRTWRPQSFGGKRPRSVRDPIVEPLWDGDRVLVHVTPGRVEIVDEEGLAVELVPEIEAAVARAARAERMVLDGYLTPQAARSSEGAILGQVAIPTASQMTTQMLLGRARDRKRELSDARPAPIQPGDTLVFVAVDLIALDGEPLFDVPLLERRRQLESVLDEGELVRIGLYVRLPIDAWVGSWRSQGFRAMAFKDANGRYRPGQKADGWAVGQIPRR